MKGLNLVLNAKSFTQPSTQDFLFQGGVEHTQANSRFKLLANLRTLQLESQLTYRFQPSAILGFNLNVDPNTQVLTKYDFGVAFEPAANLLIGLKHESLNSKKLELGKFLIHFFHYASLTQTVGSEFILDWKQKQLEARFGLTHIFNNELTGKFRVSHKGQADAALKLKLSSSVTAVASTGLDLTGISAAKAKQLPFGFTFDLKL